MVKNGHFKILCSIVQKLDHKTQKHFCTIICFYLFRDYTAWKELSEKCKSTNIGRYGKPDTSRHYRQCDWAPSPESTYEKFKSIKIRGIIDEARNGSTYRIELIPKKGPMYEAHPMIILHLAGCLAARTPVPKHIRESYGMIYEQIFFISEFYKIFQEFCENFLEFCTSEPRIFTIFKNFLRIFQECFKQFSRI